MELLIQQRWVMPSDINHNGVLFGGKLLEYIDHDCTIACFKILKIDTRLATVGMDRTYWLKPAYVGDRLKFEYFLAHIGKTSLTVFVKVFNQNNELVFKTLTSLVCVLFDHPSETRCWLLPGFENYLKNTKLSDMVERLRMQHKDDPDWWKQL
jgi:acyl-CoA hydrolase